MRLIAALLATATFAVAISPVALPAQTAPHGAEAAFAGIADRYVKAIARFAPSYGTVLGDHRFDDQLPDVSAAGRAAQAAFDRALLADLEKIDRSQLSRDAQVDAALLDNALRYDLWSIDTLQSWAWDTQVYNDIIGGSLYGLAARDFAPWPQRLKAAAARMEKMPALLAQMRKELVPARVPPVYAETWAKQNRGALDIADSMLAPHKGALAPADQQRFDAALATLKAAIAEHQKWLDTILVPQAKGDFRLGATLYNQKMRFALLSSMTRAELKTRAEAAAKATRDEMYGLARKALAGRPGAPATPDAPSAEQQQAAIEAALELSYAQRPPRSGVEAKARATLAEATAFVRAKALVTVPDAPVKIITMPKFQQGVAVAYCDSPGALERNLDTFYAISPIPDDWSDAQATSFLREYNDYMMQDMSIHEAMPGHYLQIAHANANPSILRAVLASGSFVEGWAVYAEGMMKEAGYRDGDPLFQLTVLKMRLRSITNTLLDIGIQTEGMTRDQAMALMTKGAFQQEREAAGKWTRASLSSTQLLSYFVGYAEHMALRDEARQRQGAQFDLKKYNDAVLAHGSPPVRYARALMFDEKVE